MSYNDFDSDPDKRFSDALLPKATHILQQWYPNASISQPSDEQDIKQHIDLWLEDWSQPTIAGALAPIQVKTLRHCYAKGQTFTAEYHQKRRTKYRRIPEPGEFYHCRARWYMHGYATTDDPETAEIAFVYLLRWPELKQHILRTYDLEAGEHIRATGRSNANFVWMPYADIPADLILQRWPDN